MMRKNCYNPSKKHFSIFKFLEYPDTASILLVDIGSQYLAFIDWYFLERFSKLSYHIFTNSKDKLLDDLCHLCYCHHTTTLSMFTVAPAILFYQIYVS